VLAPHHGSLRSRPHDFARWCRPQWLIVSGAANGLGRQGQQGAASGDALVPAHVLHTARDGCVRVELSAEGVRVQPLRTRLAGRDPASTPAKVALAP
jgi:competence protein ComEC